MSYILVERHCHDDDVFTSMAWQGYEHWFHAHVSHAMRLGHILIAIFLSIWTMYTLFNSGLHILSVAYECRWLTLYFTARLGGLTQAYVVAQFRRISAYMQHSIWRPSNSSAAAGRRQNLRNTAIGVGRQKTHV